ncbi:hypothetical protein ACJX0J_031124, partial [Zea mays]
IPFFSHLKQGALNEAYFLNSKGKSTRCSESTLDWSNCIIAVSEGPCFGIINRLIHAEIAWFRWSIFLLTSYNLQIIKTADITGVRTSEGFISFLIVAYIAISYFVRLCKTCIY